MGTGCFVGISDALGISHILLRYIYIYDCCKLKFLASRHASGMVSEGPVYVCTVCSVGIPCACGILPTYIYDSYKLKL